MVPNQAALIEEALPIRHGEETNIGETFFCGHGPRGPNKNITGCLSTSVGCMCIGFGGGDFDPE